MCLPSPHCAAYYYTRQAFSDPLDLYASGMSSYTGDLSIALRHLDVNISPALISFNMEDSLDNLVGLVGAAAKKNRVSSRF